MNKILFMIIFSYLNTLAQVDTSDYYPLAIGNKWEYYTVGSGYTTVEIIGDTLMPNGETYFIFNENGVDAWKYQRKSDKNTVVCYSTPNGKEDKLFDFTSQKKSVWNVSFSWNWGVYDIWNNYDGLFETYLNKYEYRHVLIDSTVLPPDTLWEPVVDVYPTLLTKYYGISSYSYGLQELVGAKINGVEYGTLVNINERKYDLISEYKLYQNYPNPFNATTQITYQLVKSTYISIKVYNLLGQELVELYQGLQSEGRHSVTFEASFLPSGFYIITLSGDDYHKSIKALLLK